MNKLIGMIILASLMFVGCARINNGEEGVLVKKPIFFGHGGVDSDPVKTGLTWIAPSTEVISVHMLPFKIDEEFKDLMSKDTVPLDFHTALRVQVTNSVDLIKRFGVDWYGNNIQRHYQNLVRDAAKNYNMTDLAIQQSAVDAMGVEVKAALTSFVEQEKIPIRVIEVTIGRANPPAEVTNARTETAAQQQRIKTEEQRKLAEDARRIAESSRAQADRAYQDNMGLSPEQFVRLEQIRMMKDVCNKGNCTFIMGGNAAPIIATK